MSKIIEIGITELNNKLISNVERIDLVEGKGIKGDRYFKEFNDIESQITLIESENIDYYNNLFNTNFLYKDFRRNLITKDIKLNDLIDKKLSIGNAIILVHDLCRPCKTLQEKLGKDNIIKEFLRKGGLRCQILKSGSISIGDLVKVI